MTGEAARKVALVSGAASRIGRAAAEACPSTTFVNCFTQPESQREVAIGITAHGEFTGFLTFAPPRDVTVVCGRHSSWR
jgi:NAD(P)-dependent dehydrogenase (short-subunit alcohol dehydrogenase family)